MKTVGYLEGTDSIYLTRLAARGVDTLPLGNGADNHGKYIGFIDRSDSLDLVIGYFHKVVPLTEQGARPQDLLRACHLNKIPVMLIVPTDLHDKVKAILGDVSSDVRLVDPGDVISEVRKLLSI